MITKVEVYGVHRAPALSLGGFMPSDDPVVIRNLDGIGPVKAEITTTPSGTSRGETFQSSSATKRNIVLTLGLNPNWSTQTMSNLRQMLYSYFMTEQWCKLRFYSDELPATDIEGYVESFEPNIFSEDPEIQISIINPKPDFIEIDATIFKGVVDIGGDDATWLEVAYEGNVSSGLEIRVDRSVDRPTYSGPLTISVENFKGVQAIVVNPVTIDTVKSFKMSSVQNQKRVQNEVIADGTITNLIKLMSGVWPELQPGDNLINVKADQPGQTLTLAYFNRFGGL